MTFVSAVIALILIIVFFFYMHSIAENTKETVDLLKEIKRK